MKKGFWCEVKIDLEGKQIIVPKRRDVTGKYADGEDCPVRFDRANYTVYSMVNKNTVEYTSKEELMDDIQDKLQELFLLRETVVAFLKKKATFADLKAALK